MPTCKGAHFSCVLTALQPLKRYCVGTMDRKVFVAW
nr:MAG TPA: hypothetical protein [Bacteriophage sp.]DAU54601.1 MAG TPA: hypothetical protein [Caudoviricetes sp.]